MRHKQREKRERERAEVIKQYLPLKLAKEWGMSIERLVVLDVFTAIGSKVHYLTAGAARQSGTSARRQPSGTFTHFCDDIYTQFS